MTFKAKHKASSRYGIVDEQGSWVGDFLGTKEEAQTKADELNTEQLSLNENQVPPTIEQVAPNKDQEITDEPFKGIVTGSDEDITASLPELTTEPSVTKEDYETKKQESSVKEVTHPSDSRARARFVLTKDGWVEQ